MSLFGFHCFKENKMEHGCFSNHYKANSSVIQTSLEFFLSTCASTCLFCSIWWSCYVVKVLTCQQTPGTKLQKCISSCQPLHLKPWMIVRSIILFCLKLWAKVGNFCVSIPSCHLNNIVGINQIIWLVLQTIGGEGAMDWGNKEHKGRQPCGACRMSRRSYSCNNKTPMLAYSVLSPLVLIYKLIEDQSSFHEFSLWKESHRTDNQQSNLVYDWNSIIA